MTHVHNTDRFEPEDRTRVIELYTAGWDPAQIRGVMAIENRRVPSATAIRAWGRYYRRPRERARRELEARIQVLADAGVGPTAIAKVIAIDFPQAPPLTRYGVTGVLTRSKATA